MCSPSAPKPPPATPKQDPRVLLSRKQFDDLLISGNASDARINDAGPGGPPTPSNPGLAVLPSGNPLTDRFGIFGVGRGGRQSIGSK